jgi:hypothetical protein
MYDAFICNREGRRLRDWFASVDALGVRGERLDVRLLVRAVGAVRGEVCFVDNDVGKVVCV